MGAITVFLDDTGRPIGTCPAGQESEWLSGVKGDARHAQRVARQVRSTDAEWHAWARRNMKAGSTGLCIPW